MRTERLAEHNQCRMLQCLLLATPEPFHRLLAIQQTFARAWASLLVSSKRRRAARMHITSGEYAAGASPP